MDPSVRREIQERVALDPPPPVEVGSADRFGPGLAAGMVGLALGLGAWFFVGGSLETLGIAWFVGTIGMALRPSVTPGPRYFVGAVLGALGAVAAVAGFIVAMFATGTWKIGGW